MKKLSCGQCGATDVRLYRPYGSFYRPKDNRCNAHVTKEERGWYVPCVIDEDGTVWGYLSVPEKERQKFYALPEASNDFPNWVPEQSKWSDSVLIRKAKP